MTRTRTAHHTETLPSGARVVRTSVVAAPELEWRLQAAAVRAVKAMPGFNRTFTLAADFNAGRRSPQESVKAAATGIAPGEPDLRLYLSDGRLRLIEYKGAKGRLSVEQVARHGLLRLLGHVVAVIKAATPEDAAAQTLATVGEWLAE